MTPSQAIVSATKHGAMASRGLKDFGTLETGKYADLVLLNADPLADIHNVRKIGMVIKEGSVIDIEHLPTNPCSTRRPSPTVIPMMNPRLLTILTLGAFVAPRIASAMACDIAIVGATLLDGNGGAPLRDAWCW